MKLNAFESNTPEPGVVFVEFVWLMLEVWALKLELVICLPPEVVSVTVASILKLFAVPEPLAARQ